MQKVWLASLDVIGPKFGSSASPALAKPHQKLTGSPTDKRVEMNPEDLENFPMIFRGQTEIPKYSDRQVETNWPGRGHTSYNPQAHITSSKRKHVLFVQSEEQLPAREQRVASHLDWNLLTDYFLQKKMYKIQQRNVFCLLLCQSNFHILHVVQLDQRSLKKKEGKMLINIELWNWPFNMETLNWLAVFSVLHVFSSPTYRHAERLTSVWGEKMKA